MLSRSVVQALGIDQILERHRFEAIQKGEVARMEGDIGAAKALGEAQVYTADKVNEVAKVQARNEKGASIWSGVLTGVAAIAGASFLPGMTATATGGGMTAMQGAQLGASVGNAVTGGKGPGTALSSAINTYGTMEQTREDNLLKKSLTDAQVAYYGARTDKVENTPPPTPKTPKPAKVETPKPTPASPADYSKVEMVRNKFTDALNNPKGYLKEEGIKVGFLGDKKGAVMNDFRTKITNMMPLITDDKLRKEYQAILDNIREMQQK